MNVLFCNCFVEFLFCLIVCICMVCQWCIICTYYQIQNDDDICYIVTTSEAKLEADRWMCCINLDFLFFNITGLSMQALWLFLKNGDLNGALCWSLNRNSGSKGCRCNYHIFIEYEGLSKKGQFFLNKRIYVDILLYSFS